MIVKTENQNPGFDVPDIRQNPNQIFNDAWDAVGGARTHLLKPVPLDVRKKNQPEMNYKNFIGKLRQDSRKFDLADIDHEAMTRVTVTGVCILPLHQIPELKESVHLHLHFF